MRLTVDKIDDSGKTVDIALDTPWAVEAVQAVLEVSAVALNGRLQVHPPVCGTVRVRARWSLEAERDCDRCGSTFLHALEGDAELHYVPGPIDGPADLELKAEDLDVGWYLDGELDLAEVLREAVALTMPSRVVCTDAEGCARRVEELLSPPAANGRENPFAALRQRT